LREEHRLRVFENRVLREIFGPKKDEMTREDLYDLFFSPNVIRVISSRTMRWARHVALMGDRRVACSILGSCGISCVADDMLAPQGGLCCMKIVI